MLFLVPAFVGGMPGGVELLVIFVVMLLLFGLPLALAVLLGYRYLSGQSGASAKDERIEELESELETLEAQVEEGEGPKEPRDTSSAEQRSADSRAEELTDDGETASESSDQQTVSQTGGESDEQ